MLSLARFRAQVDEAATDPFSGNPATFDEIEKRIVHANCQERRELRMLQSSLARAYEVLDGLLEISALGEPRRLERPAAT